MGQNPISFSEALLALKSGQRIFRTGWHLAGMYLTLQVPDEHSKMTLPYIYLTIPGNISADVNNPAQLVPWLASQTDILAHDWSIV